jgi:hypothetical protein
MDTTLRREMGKPSARTARTPLLYGTAVRRPQPEDACGKGLQAEAHTLQGQETFWVG